MNCSLPHFSVRGIFQARVLEWVAISFPRGSSQPRDRTWVSHIVVRCFTMLKLLRNPIITIKLDSVSSQIFHIYFTMGPAVFWQIFFFFFNFLATLSGMGELPWPGIELSPTAVEAQSLNHLTTREAPGRTIINI